MSNAIEVTEATWDKDVVERSHDVPVVVDFWAAWCGPCRSLGPVLERLADEADGDWVLAKVDVDSNQRLAAEFGIQGIPAVRAWRDGREVDEFVGALPEPQVRMWLDGLGPSPADIAVEQGSLAEARGDLPAAEAAYSRAVKQDPGHAGARAGLERVGLLIRVGDADEAALKARLARDPADVEAVVQLADLDAARGEFSRAFDLLVDAVRTTSGDERETVRKHLLKLLELVPTDDPAAMAARRALSLALF
ncbi:MAG: tetratricopeptide repeat protein [Actinomycetota bacterium]|nr:tetratricopeptide repeat protein [Actinomycetota bacterium]